jgi:hypothetical protein
VADLIAFLRARLDEDWAAARDLWVPEELAGTVADTERVLADVDAKRRIIDDWLESVRDPCDGLSDDELHDRRAHPDYQYATTEGPCKVWDWDVPPDGDGWERNTTACDPEAWERFDYTEESYWRRVEPDGPIDRMAKPPTYIRLLALPYANHPDYCEEWRPTWLT